MLRPWLQGSHDGKMTVPQTEELLGRWLWGENLAVLKLMASLSDKVLAEWLLIVLGLLRTFVH